ncbi:DUF6529 family protein [Pseudonocardia sp. RS010]|uniref:DUF6529 family protein n=1 Tax=Pseudonocardia sp. RS010 TaxID=3385979 RepID=UPI0039A3127C
MSRSPRTGATDLGYDPETGTHPDAAGTGYRPEYDPGRFDPPTLPDLPTVRAHPDTGMQEATTSIFAAVPARDESADPTRADPTRGHRSWDRPDPDDESVRDESAAPAWADPTWADPTWGHRSWDRPDPDDESDLAYRAGSAAGRADDLDDLGRFGGFGGFDAPAHDPAGESLRAAADVVETPGRPGSRLGALLVPVVVGVAISVGLGVYARVHEGTGTAINLAGFSSGLAAKSWLTAAAFVLVLVQLWTSMRMYGRIGRRPAGRGTATVHRWSGRLAVLLTIPVAVHCLYALGYSDANLRVLLHSLLGCFFYGAFAAKMLVLPKRDAPRWALPVLGGLVFVVLTGLFLTSSVWFFTTTGLTF